MPILPTNHNCPYLSSDEFYNSTSEGKFSIVSLNIRSINGKISEVSNFLHNPHSDKLIDILALQEIWNVPPGVEYNIVGFHPLLFKTRDSSGHSANAGGGRLFYK